MRFKRWLLICAICLLGAGAMAGCDSSPPQPAVIIDPTVTPAPQMEALTDTPEPTAPPPEPTETPETGPWFQSNLSEEGPWLVYAAEDGVYALNLDGSGLTRLYANSPSSTDVESIKIVAAPQGGRIAVLQVDTQDRLELGMPRLKTFWMPDAYLVLDTWLIPYEWEAETYVGKWEEMSDQEKYDYTHEMPLEQMFAAIGEWNEITWSSDGTLLAFNAVFDGTSADLYLYNDNDLSITRLTDGPGHSVDPVFTPDNTTILHGAVESLNYGMTDLGFDYLNAWVANIDGSGAKKVFDHQFYGWEEVVAWLDDTTYVAVAATWADLPYYFDLRIVDIFDGQQKVLVWGSHSAVDVAPEEGKVLFSVLAYGAGGEHQPDFDPGVYLMDLNSNAVTLVPGIDTEEVIHIQYNPVSNVFYISDRTGKFYLVQMDGSVQSFQALEDYYVAYLSPDGTRWVLWKTFYTANIAAGDLEGLFDEISPGKRGYPVWMPDSSGVLFLMTTEDGNTALARLSFPENGGETTLELLVDDLPAPFNFYPPLVLVNP